MLIPPRPGSRRSGSYPMVFDAMQPPSVRRWARICVRKRASEGVSRVILWKASLSITSALTGPSAKTSAVRGSPVMSAISPKNCPRESFAIIFSRPLASRIGTRTSPEAMMYIASPGSPRAMIRSPGAKSRKRTSFAIPQWRGRRRAVARPERCLGGAEWAHRPPRRRTIAIGVCCTALAVLLVSSRRGDAVCNVIPGTTQTFRASQTTVDRPFASPGDFVELGLDPTCYAAPREFSTNPGNQVVTVAFTPPQGGSRNIVVLAAECGAVAPALDRCAAPGAASAHCLPLNLANGDLQVIDSRHLRFRFPDTSPCFDPTQGLPFTGPATVAITNVGDPLPLTLGSHPCSQQAGLLACVDALFAVDGTCDTTPHPLFSHFTALPFPNDYQAICTGPSATCTGRTRALQLTVDAVGDVLLPMDWSGVLVRLMENQDVVPVPRTVRASFLAEAFRGTGVPIGIPDDAFLGSFSPDGRKLPPIFTPLHDPTALGEVTLFGSVDAPHSVLRVARLSCAGGTQNGSPCTTAADCPGGGCGPARCVGGSAAGQPCVKGVDCPGGACEQGLVDLSTRLVGGVGPIGLPLGTCGGGAGAGMACTEDNGCPGGQCRVRVAAFD